MNSKEFVQAFPVFKNSPEVLLRDLLSAGRRQVLLAGKQIYSEGDSCSAIALVLSGEIRVYKIGETGRELPLYEIGPGETCILNASCTLAGQGYPAHAAAVMSRSSQIGPCAAIRSML